MTTDTGTKPAVTDEKTPSGPVAGEADAPPTTVSLDVVTAMHRRLLKLQGDHTASTSLLSKIEEEVKTLSKYVGGEILARLEELATSVIHHADLIDSLAAALDRIGQRLAPAPARGVVPRTLPSQQKPADVEGAVPTGDDGTELQIDPKKIGTQVVKLPSGQEVEVRVRRPGPAVLRDGNRVEQGQKTRRS